MEKILYQIVVKGRVQGVWFRKYTVEKAKSIGINGFVRNDLNYVVYIEAEGTLEQLKKFIEWLHRGSPLSKVSSVEYKIGELMYYDSFQFQV
jgi:acylphosphatase